MTCEVMDSGRGSPHDGPMTTNPTTTNPTPADFTPDAPTAGTGPADMQRDCERKLRVVLRLNATNSFVFGALLAAFPDQVAELLDTGYPGWIRLVGLGLLSFGALCAWSSTASLPMLRRITPQIVIGDVAWVVASVATVLLGWYSGGGIVAVLAMAAIVDVFALLQWTAWRRLRVTH
jgi:hypothetical protein